MNNYIYDVIPLNNSMFDYFVDRLYPTELEINNTTNTAAYFDIMKLSVSFC